MHHNWGKVALKKKYCSSLKLVTGHLHSLKVKGHGPEVKVYDVNK